MGRLCRKGRATSAFAPPTGDEGITASMAPCRRVGDADYVQMARGEGGKKSPVARASHQGIAAHLSVGRSVSGAQPSIRAADAAARD